MMASRDRAPATKMRLLHELSLISFEFGRSNPKIFDSLGAYNRSQSMFKEVEYDDTFPPSFFEKIASLFVCMLLISLSQSHPKMHSGCGCQELSPLITTDPRNPRKLKPPL